jgi:hypothetical protein
MTHLTAFGGMYTDWERGETAWLLADLDQYLDTMEAALEDTSARMPR